MDQTAWNAVNTVLASVAILIAVIAAWYTRAQVVLIRQERAKLDVEESELICWSDRANIVVQKLKVPMPRQLIESGSSLYNTIIPDPELRGLVESHLVHYQAGSVRVEARTISTDQLRLPAVRRTIEQVEKRFAAVKAESPEIAAKSSL
jgi:hypothetical protein